MKRSQRRLNYKEFASTGHKVYVDTDIQDIDELNNQLQSWSLSEEVDSSIKVAMTDQLQKLMIDEASLADEINDVMEENDISDIHCTIDEVKEVMLKVENLRSTYRRIHKEIELVMDNYHERYEKSFTSRMESVKEYIKCANKLKRSMQVETTEETKLECEIKGRTLEFQINAVFRMLIELKDTFTDDVKIKSDVEIKIMRDELSMKHKEVKKVGEKLEEMFKSTDHKRMDDINQLNERYEQIIVLRDLYCNSVKAEVDNREIDKIEAFKASSLNIKLTKYKGYDSNVDVYTFQNLFEKLYLKTTPKKLLPDLLKNLSCPIVS